MPVDYLKTVKRCVAEVLAMDPDEIAAESRLIDDLGADSLDLVELMYLLEQALDLRLDKDDLDSGRLTSPLTVALVAGVMAEKDANRQ